MTVSRKSPGEMCDDEMTVSDYMADKRECQDRSGYPTISDAALAEKAVDEKLPMGSQSY